jgi:hypothetical protein
LIRAAAPPPRNPQNGFNRRKMEAAAKRAIEAQEL